ncbi:MAG: tetratricopeptide repeat protein [Geminicoccaceae bacterium]
MSDFSEDVASTRHEAVILSADLFGYTRMMHADETGTIERLGQALNLFRQLIGDYGGSIIDTAGDGVMSIFEHADSALNFALSIQRDFGHDAVWHAGKDPLCFRIGIHRGSVIERDGRVHGLTLAIAARIQSRALPGGICISEQLHAALKRNADLRLRSIGRPVMHNLDEPIQLFSVDLDLPMPEPESVQTADPADLPADVGKRYELSVAVLPFTNLSGDPADSHLCDGMASDIVSSLSRFRDLAVIARHSSFMFRNTELARSDVGAALGARYIVNGTMQRAGPRIRVRVQLVEAETNMTVWAQHYDGTLQEIFEFQDDVTSQVASQLFLQISTVERQKLDRQHVPGIEAYGLTLRAHELVLLYRRETNTHALRLFEQATELDRGYGRAFAGLSRTFNLAWRYRWHDDPKACLAKAVELARTAVSSDPADSRGYSELGFALLYQRQHDPSLAAYRQSLELNANDADMIVEYADALVYAGDPRESLKLIERAIRLNPFTPDHYFWALGDAFFALGEYEHVIEALSRMRDPSQGMRLLAASHAHLGNDEEAGRIARRILARDPDFTVDHWATVPPHRHEERRARLIEGLKRAGLH